MRAFVCKSLGLGLLTLLTACGMESIAWEGTDDPMDRTFQVSPGGQLTVDSDLGSIEVRTEAANRVDVHIVRSANTQDSARAAEMLKDVNIQMDQSGNSVTVTARVPHSGWWNRNRNVRLEFQITVPERVQRRSQDRGRRDHCDRPRRQGDQQDIWRRTAVRPHSGSRFRPYFRGRNRPPVLQRPGRRRDVRRRDHNRRRGRRCDGFDLGRADYD